MADYIFIRKSRNRISKILHIILNILLGAGSVLITALTKSWVLGILLVFVSKWRIFAVRPRFWFLNIKSNLIDIIIGSSFVLISYYITNGTNPLIAHYILAALYAIWLTIIKPISNEKGVIVQSLSAIFLGSTAVVLLTSPLEPNETSIAELILAVTEFIIGYAAARHILIQKSAKDFILLSMVCGLLCGEISIFTHAWSILYTISDFIIIPQLSIILTIASFSIIKIYYSMIKHDGKIIGKDIAAPLLFGIIAIAIVLAFSKPTFII